MPERPDLGQLQDDVVQLLRRSQEAILDAGRSFTDRAASVVPGDREAVERLVDDALSFTERVLKAQRELAQSIVQAVNPTGTGLTDESPEPPPDPDDGS